MTRRNSRKIAVMVMTLCVLSAGCTKEEKLQPPAAPAKPVPKAVQSLASSAGSARSKGLQKQATSSKAPLKAFQNQSTTLKRVASAGSQPDFTGKKDPFKPFVIEPPAQVKKAAPRTSTTSTTTIPIQSIDVSKFTLVGIIAGLNENRALIVDPFSKGYVVKQGMQLGNNNGRITRITGDAVEVLEQFRDDGGILRKRTVRLVLTHKSKETVR